VAIAPCLDRDTRRAIQSRGYRPQSLDDLTADLL